MAHRNSTASDGCAAPGPDTVEVQVYVARLSNINEKHGAPSDGLLLPLLPPATTCLAHPCRQSGEGVMMNGRPPRLGTYDIEGFFRLWWSDPRLAYNGATITMIMLSHDLVGMMRRVMEMTPIACARHRQRRLRRQAGAAGQAVVSPTRTVGAGLL